MKRSTKGGQYFVLVACSLAVAFVFWRGFQPGFEIEETQEELISQAADFAEEPRQADTSENEISDSGRTLENKEAYTATQAVDEREGEEPSSEARFRARHLSQPGPESITDLLKHLTPFIEPELPMTAPDQPKSLDGSILKVYRGYLKMPGGDFLRIQVDRNTGGVTLSVEQLPGGFRNWSSPGELELRNFKADPYSLVFLIPQRTICYLKFLENVHPGSEFPTSGLKGSFVNLESEEGKGASAVALVEYDEPNHGFPPEDPEQGWWPPTHKMNEIMPSPIPR